MNSIDKPNTPHATEEPPEFDSALMLTASAGGAR
jgi:hypothetical protein